MSDAFADLDRWIGKAETATDTVTATPARALAATLDRDLRFDAGDPLPPPWHWQYFLTMIRRTSRIAGVDVKEGRSGMLVFVTVRHEIARGGDDRLAPVEMY